MCTFSIVFLTSYARIHCDLEKSDDRVQIGLINAFSTIVFIMVCYPQTRCHFTPTLTVADIIYKDLGFINGMMILISQFVGCLFANACVILTLSMNELSELANKSVIGMSTLNENFTSINGFLIDSILASLFVYANLTYSDHSKTDRSSVTKYAMVRGIVIFMICLVGDTICGADSNPFSVLSAAIITKQFRTHQWIYIISPIVASFLGGILYNTKILSEIFSSEEDPSDQNGKLKSE